MAVATRALSVVVMVVGWWSPGLWVQSGYGVTSKVSSYLYMLYVYYVVSMCVCVYVHVCV